MYFFFALKKTARRSHIRAPENKRPGGDHRDEECFFLFPAFGNWRRENRLSERPEGLTCLSPRLAGEFQPFSERLRFSANFQLAGDFCATFVSRQKWQTIFRMAKTGVTVERLTTGIKIIFNKPRFFIRILSSQCSHLKKRALL
jgi:hypothetical protein